ncbi:MAG: ribose-5-phosphate isomerase [Nocardioidaceae bacterium]|nr:ribose-5-phosphate isomerase [Nocardioidaceae bacterium]
MRVHLASDHAGLELKEQLVSWLRARGHDLVDHGSFVYDDLDDYPAFCLRAAEAVVDDLGSVGVVIGGSGNGEQIAANKVKGVRAVLAWSVETAELGRLHNNANVVSLGARMHPVADALSFVEVFLSTDFTGEDRHQRRISMLSDYEQTGQLPTLPPSAAGGRPADDG